MVWRTALWVTLGSAVMCLLLWVFLGMALAANQGCGDVLDFAAYRTADEGWVWVTLGTADGGSAAFILRNGSLWEVVTVRGTTACLVLAGGPV